MGNNVTLPDPKQSLLLLYQVNSLFFVCLSSHWIELGSVPCPSWVTPNTSTEAFTPVIRFYLSLPLKEGTFTTSVHVINVNVSRRKYPWILFYLNGWSVSIVFRSHGLLMNLRSDRWMNRQKAAAFVSAVSTSPAWPLSISLELESCAVDQSLQEYLVFG